MSFKRNEETSACEKINIFRIALAALARNFRSAVQNITTSIGAGYLLCKIRDAEQRDMHHAFVAIKLLEKLLEIFITDRPSVMKSSSSKDIHEWVYASEGVMKFFWWRRESEQYSAFAEKWIVRLTSAILEEASGDAYTQKTGYWRDATVDLFMENAKWNDDPAKFLVGPEHVFNHCPPFDRVTQMTYERIGRKFLSEQEFLWWQLEWIDPLCLKKIRDIQGYVLDQEKIHNLRSRLYYSIQSQSAKSHWRDPDSIKIEAEINQKIGEMITARIARKEQELKGRYINIPKEVNLQGNTERLRQLEWDQFHLAIRLDKAALLFLVG